MLPLIRDWLSGSGLPGFPDEDGLEYMAGLECIDAIEGGYALVQGDKLIEPDCCCEFLNLKNWTEVLKKQPKHGYVWTGHPGLEINFEADRVSVRQLSEDGYPPPELLTTMAISVSELQTAVSQAEMMKARFTGDLLEQVIQVIGLRTDRELAAHVTSRLLGEC